MSTTTFNKGKNGNFEVATNGVIFRVNGETTLYTDPDLAAAAFKNAIATTTAV